MKETKDLETRFQAKADELKNQQTAAQSKVKALQDQRALFKAGSAEYENANKEIMCTAIEAQTTLQLTQQELVQEQKRQTRAVVDKITTIVGKLAADKKLSLVLTQTVPQDVNEEQFDRLTPEQLNQLLSARNVLYVAPENDLTTAVITAMDAGYTPPAGGAAGR